MDKLEALRKQALAEVDSIDQALRHRQVLLHQARIFARLFDSLPFSDAAKLALLGENRKRETAYSRVVCMVGAEELTVGQLAEMKSRVIAIENELKEDTAQ